MLGDIPKSSPRILRVTEFGNGFVVGIESLATNIYHLAIDDGFGIELFGPDTETHSKTPIKLKTFG